MDIPKKIKDFRVIVDNRLKDFGETDLKRRVVKINKKKSLRLGGNVELADTIRHETLHVLYPNMSENEVRKEVIKQTGHETDAFSDSDSKKELSDAEKLAIAGMV